MKFSLFKSKTTNEQAPKKMDYEITSNPGLLYNPHINYNDIQIHGLKLGDPSTLITQKNILTTTLEQSPQGINKFTFKNNKTYCHTDNGLVEYLLMDRIKSVLEHGGIIHMKTGAKYVIQQKVISGIGIHENILEPYLHIKKSGIEQKFGKADTIKEEFEEVDGTLSHTEYIYKDRQMRISFSDWYRKISFINIGEFWNRNTVHTSKIPPPTQVPSR